MNSRFLAQRLLASSTEGSKINLIPAKFCFPPILKDEYGDREGFHMSELLKFEEYRVPNLYSYDAKRKRFRFNYTDGDYIARTSDDVLGYNEDFNVIFVDEPFVDWGMNFLGYIQVKFNDERNSSFKIMLPGERSYDPAGKSGEIGNECVDADQFNFILAVTAAQVMAATLGARESLIDGIFKATRKIARNYGREMLLEWMYVQVKLICYRKLNPPPYPDFIRQKVMSRVFTIETGKSDHTKEYLERYLSFENGKLNYDQVTPPNQYYQTIINKEEKALEKELGKDKLQELKDRILTREFSTGFVLKYLPNLLTEKPEKTRMTFDEFRHRVRRLEEVYCGKVTHSLREAGHDVRTITIDKSIREQCIII